MASELISKWQELEALKDALKAQIRGIEDAQGRLRDAMPKIWYIDGFGNNGFTSDSFCFSESELIVKTWLIDRNFEINSFNQFYPNDGNHYQSVSGMVKFVTPIDRNYEYIKSLYEAQVKEGK